MIFNSLSFVFFLFVVLIVLLVLQNTLKSITIRNVVLLIASYCFYGSFNIGFLLILVYVTLIGYFYGIKFSKPNKSAIGIAVTLSLLPLLFFKYSLFLVESFSSISNMTINTELLEGLVLPVGISFFTFQSISYIIDIYRGKIEKEKSLSNYSLFVSFFPTILSGPIEKAHNLLPQINSEAKINLKGVEQGIIVFIWGLFKKIVVADRLGYYVDHVYSNYQFQNGSTLALAAVFYSFQIYCDFSGYSDMALGSARILGFDITKNFRLPYFATSIKAFWRRWHIALTSWFTEYVYFSLGGNRVKLKIQWIFNISMVFILSGIWHGAAWSFLIWGTLHAIYYLIEHYTGLQKKGLVLNTWQKVAGWLYTFVLVTLAWIFFRITDFDTACRVIGKIFTDCSGVPRMGASSFTFAGTVAVLCILYFYEILIYKGKLCYESKNEVANPWINALSVIPLLILIETFSMSSDKFVYFQF